MGQGLCILRHYFYVSKRLLSYLVRISIGAIVKSHCENCVLTGETFYDGTAAVVDNEEQRYNIHDSLTIKQIKHFEDISQPYTSDRTDNRHSIWHTSTNQAPILENARYGFNVNANTRSRARLADADTRRGRDFTGTEDYNPDTFSEPAAGLGDADSGKSRLARRISQEQEKSTMCGCCTIL